MSYELKLYAPQPDAEPLALARARHAEPGPPPAKDEPDEAAERRKRALTAALMQTNVELDAFECDYEEVAAAEGITVDEARRRHREIQLVGPENGSGVQIVLFDESAALLLPYWHGEDEAPAVWREAWSYLRTVAKQTGWFVYDPQLDRVLDLAAEADFNAARERYSATVAELRAAETGEFEPVKEKPWWRFW